MTDICLKEIREFGDNSMKQLAFFYELTKMGAVKFDLKNKLHLATMIEMINKVEEVQEKDNSQKPVSEQMFAQDRLKLYEQIVLNIVKHSIKLLED